MKNTNTLKLKYYGKTFNLIAYKETYARDDSLAITLIDKKEGEPFSCLTVNVMESFFLEPNQAYVDINNNPWALDFIEQNKLGKFIGRYAHSGYCTYPLFEFDLSKLAV